MEASVTHQNQQESLTTPWDSHQFSTGALGTQLQTTAEPSVPAAAELSPLPAGLLQHTLCWKCIFTNHGQTKHSLQEMQESLLGGWEMSTVLPRTGGSAVLNSEEGVTKTSSVGPGEQKSAFHPAANKFSTSCKSLNAVCKPSLGLSLRVTEELEGCWNTGSLWELMPVLMPKGLCLLWVRAKCGQGDHS